MITSKIFGYYQWEADASKTYREYFDRLDKNTPA